MGDQFIITSVHFALEMKQGQKKKTTETAVLPSKKQVDTDESDVCMQTRMRNKSWSQSTLVAMGDEKKKTEKLIEKLTVWGEDCSLDVGRSGRCVAAGCVRATMRVRARLK